MLTYEYYANYSRTNTIVVEGILTKFEENYQRKLNIESGVRRRFENLNFVIVVLTVLIVFITMYFFSQPRS